MSFFKTASLVLVSDFAAASASAVGGTNTGKAYSIKPTDGSGDFDFERGSDITATRVNKDGYIEKGRGNFLLQSNQFDTTWTTSNASVSSGQSGYDGSNDAWLLTANGSNSYIEQTHSVTGVRTFSVYVKAGTADDVAIVNGNQTAAYFDLTNGSLSSLNNLGIDAKSTDIGNGWYRLELVADSTSMVRIYPADGTSTTGGTIYIQDAQLEQGLVATDYIETTTAPLRAGLLEDEPRFDYHNSASATPNTCPSLLLEPSRTNQIRSSEYFEDTTNYDLRSADVTTNYATSPEGVQNATKVIPQNATTDFRIQTQNTFGVSGNNVLSVFAKYESGGFQYLVLATNSAFQTYAFDIQNGTKVGNVGGGTIADADATIEDYGNGWYRCSIKSNNTGNADGVIYLSDDGTSATATGDGSKGMLIYGFQGEQSVSYPTSYIPTYGTAATRGADYSESSTSLSIGNSEFCAYYEMDAKTIPRESSNTFFRIEFGSNSNFIGLKGSSNSINNMYTLQTLGVYSETIGNVTESSGVVKFLINYSSGTGDLFINGTKYAGVISGPTTGNTITNIELRGSGYAHNLKQPLIFPEALSDTDCEILTGTTYSSFAAMASALNYTVYE